ncbi:MAG: hypothetical protein EBY17_22680 [Acidobacteriia bacterium]|jgi:hypothetical protein|nr:hypothetical protein [Terriglobia bacterium]
MKQMLASFLLRLLMSKSILWTSKIYAWIPGSVHAFRWAVQYDHLRWDLRQLPGGSIPVLRLHIGQKVWMKRYGGIYDGFNSRRSGTVQELHNTGAKVRHSDGKLYGWDASELMPLDMVPIKTRILDCVRQFRRC